MIPDVRQLLKSREYKNYDYNNIEEAIVRQLLKSREYKNYFLRIVSGIYVRQLLKSREYKNLKFNNFCFLYSHIDYKDYSNPCQSFPFKKLINNGLSC